MRIAALIVGVVIALALLWTAGELHYQSCVSVSRTESIGARGVATVFGDGIAKADALDVRVDRSSVKGCSRLPF